MNKAIANFLCCFIPSKEIRTSFRKKHIKKSCNIINKSQTKQQLNDEHWNNLSKYNHIEINDDDRKNIVLDIDGKNNIVIIKKLDLNCNLIKITIFGDNNKIFIDEKFRVRRPFKISFGKNDKNFGKVEDVELYIGKYSRIGGGGIISRNSHSSITIGNGCMFSWGGHIFNTDFHPIYDIESNQIINKVKDICIGDHCWIGANATILKNVTIPSDCIVGLGSVVSSTSVKCALPHSIIAGNPARVVKTGVTWHTNGSNGYIQNERS